jgi:hypothetical protein
MRLRRVYEGHRRYDVQLRRERLRGYYSDSLIAEWQGKQLLLGAGTSDWLNFYRDLDDPDSFYVLTTNRSIGYIGLERFDLRDEPHDAGGLMVIEADPYTAFEQWEGQYKDEGKPLLEMAAHNAVRYLAQWFE